MAQTHRLKLLGQAVFLYVILTTVGPFFPPQDHLCVGFMDLPCAMHTSVGPRLQVDTPYPYSSCKRDLG